MFTTEKFVETSKANLEVATQLSTKAFAGVEKLVELNVQAFKTSLAEAGEAASAALAIRSADQFIALQNSIVQPAGEKAASYARHVFDIVNQTGAEMTQVLEGVFADTQRKVVAAVDAAVQNAPLSGSVLNFAKSSMAAATTAYENVNKVAKQASGVAEANILALTTEASKVARAGKTVAAA